MNCKNVESLLSAYLDGELSGREMLELRAHINECPSCGEELRVVESVKHMLGATQIPEPSNDFEERLVANVLRATAPTPVAKRISFINLAGIAAVSMLATMLMLNMVHRNAPAPAAETQKVDAMAYEMVERDRAFAASTDGLSGSPVMMPLYDRGR